jgi:hypothetical protein
MMPSIELRLQTMVKAMADVILPAIAPENALAREQAQLMTAQLRMIAKQWPRAAEYDALELRDIAALAERLCARVTGGAETRGAAESLAALLRRREAEPTSAAREGRAAIANAIDALIRASVVDGDEAFRRMSSDAILEYSGLQALARPSLVRGLRHGPGAGAIPGDRRRVGAGRNAAR